jgi:hypothetical protein
MASQTMKFIIHLIGKAALKLFALMHKQSIGLWWYVLQRNVAISLLENWYKQWTHRNCQYISVRQIIT